MTLRLGVCLTCLMFFCSSPSRAAEQPDGFDGSIRTISTPTEPQFTKVIDDLPLMPGLQLVEDEDVLFTHESGRIAETNAMGSVDIDAVYQFYKRALPHLGWKVVNSHTYTRENEQLRIDAHANDKITIVQFSVKPL